MKRYVKKKFSILSKNIRPVLLGCCCFLGYSLCEAAIVPFSISGPVEIKDPDTTSWIPLQPSMHIPEGAHLRTSDSGELSLSCADGSELHLGPGSQLEIREASFEEQTTLRAYRLKLIRGSLDASITALKRSGFILTKDSLSWLVEEHVPQDIVEALAPLVQQTFTDEGVFLENVKTQIGGTRTSRYKLLLLESAANRNSVFVVENELSGTTVENSTEDSVLNMTVRDDGLRVDVVILQGKFLVHRLGHKGLVTIWGLSDRLREEGVRFSLDTSGGRARLANAQCELSIESNARLVDFHAFIGESDTLVSIENRGDAPSFLIKHEEQSTVRLDKEQKVLMYVPVAQQLEFEFSDSVDAHFTFCQQLSSFVFVENGCPEINGQESCHCDMSIKKEEPSPPPPPNAPTPQGGFVPPTTPPIKPGSPILPLP